MVAAVVAGDADGIAEAYDRYAASLAAYCHSMLPGPEAAEVVQDTFLIAVSRLDGLRDPDRLNAWLHAVARNECLRRLGPQGADRPGILVGGATAATWAAGAPDDLPAATLPAELRGQVLTACADNSPTGRARRVSVTHRAGAFGPSGFPKATIAAGPRWWQRVRRRPRPVAAMAAVVAVAAAVVIIMIVTAGGPHRTQASALGFGGGPVGAPSSADPGSASAASSPTHKPAASARPSAPPVTTPASPPSPVRPSMMVTVTRPKPSPSRTSPSARPSPSPSPSPSPTPSPSTPPAPGHLLAVPASLALTAAAGKAVSGTFLLTAVGGPVSEYTITVPATAGKITAAPARGSLPASGYVTITVTVTSKVALSTAITVQPGNLTVRVTFKIKA